MLKVRHAIGSFQLWRVFFSFLPPQSKGNNSLVAALNFIHIFHIQAYFLCTINKFPPSSILPILTLALGALLLPYLIASTHNPQLLTSIIIPLWSCVWIGDLTIKKIFLPVGRQLSRAHPRRPNHRPHTTVRGCSTSITTPPVHIVPAALPLYARSCRLHFPSQFVSWIAKLQHGHIMFIIRSKFSALDSHTHTPPQARQCTWFYQSMGCSWSTSFVLA